MSRNVLERTLEIVQEYSGKEVTAGSKLMEDLGFDSLDVVNVAVDLEHEFDVDLPNDDLYAMPFGVTVEELANLVKRKLATT